MTIYQSIILGIIQGITEFLPISSSGHLVLIPALFNWQIPADEAFVFDVLVQIATLFAVIIYFWSDIVQIVYGFFKGLFGKESWRSEDMKVGWLIILASIPAGIFGLLIKDLIEAAFTSIKVVGLFLVVTAIMLVIAEKVGKRNLQINHLDWKDALIIGCFQALAVFPGISRSGSTICGGMVRHLHREEAARFSFLMYIPIMAAAGLLATIDLFQMPNVSQLIPIFIPGFIVSGIVGYFSIRWLLKFLTNHRLESFSIYLIIIGLVALLMPSL